MTRTACSTITLPQESSPRQQLGEAERSFLFNSNGLSLLGPSGLAAQQRPGSSVAAEQLRGPSASGFQTQTDLVSAQRVRPDYSEWY